MNWNTYFTYNGDTGDLVWKRWEESIAAKSRTMSRWNTMFAGRVAGCRAMQKGGQPMAIMVQVRELAPSRLCAHRIIWEMHNGPIPDGIVIDHINGDPFDNRLSNLRLATSAENNWNRRPHSNSRSGLKGAHWDNGRKKWLARIMVNGKLKSLGRYATKEEAHATYCIAAKQHHGDFARTI